MTQTMNFKAPIFTGLISLLLTTGLSACKAPVEINTTKTQPALNTRQFPPLRKALSCLPESAAMIAAHRGTDERWRNTAENSIGGLKALIEHGTLIAEIDVAGLKDKTLITFHDGVWDKISTGKGPISVSTKKDLENILLKSRAGELTTDRPPLFIDMLRTAKDKIYLEIDFKSSANPKDVITEIRRADMADHVLLIAYSAKQAARLERLAPDMLRSNPPEASQPGHAVWLGYEVANGDTARTLKSKNKYIIGRIGDPRRQPPLKTLSKAADILVTDQAKRHDGIIGLTGKSRKNYDACLSESP